MEPTKVQNRIRAKRVHSGMVGGHSVADEITDVIIGLILLGVAFICVIPLWHVLMASLSDGRALLAHDGALLLPVGKLNFEGYKLVFKDSAILKGYGNTLLYVVCATSIGMCINIVGGYVLSRKTAFRPFMIIMLMFTMMFNGGLIPTYNVIRALGFVGTRWSLIIPGCTMAIFVIMLMNAFQSVPESTLESAAIDGAGHFRIMLQVALPQTGGITVVVLLNTVIIQWNAWFNASIYVTNKRDLWPLQLWIRQIVADNANILQGASPDYDRLLIQYAVIMAATIPILVAFPFFQKKLEAGVITGGVKG
ncbi:MAG: carbohydrate ABC transporter permease [Clostridiales bacterium]|nr:carbohydrate ABC transporter permease [Clostridiales bacterium]